MKGISTQVSREIVDRAAARGTRPAWNGISLGVNVHPLVGGDLLVLITRGVEGLQSLGKGVARDFNIRTTALRGNSYRCTSTSGDV
jgi:hypothetical protein